MAGNPLGFDFNKEVNIFGGNSKSKYKRQSVGRTQKDVVWSNQKGKCWFCKKTLNPLSTHYDHIKEVSRGGKSTTDNLRAVCASCHSERHKREKAEKLDKKKRASSTRQNANPYEIKPIKFNQPKLDFGFR